ncbi:MAG: ribonuclease H-like domain-containing protein [candidate division Zixibacteria bacterium]
MDLEKRLYEALKSHGKTPEKSKSDLFKEPPIGTVRETSAGPIWMVETAYDEGYLHGRVELSNSIAGTALPYFESSLDYEKFATSGIAVIDTETTGLAGGTGTYPFILGVGFFINDKFVVRQYILRDFAEEPAQLAAFTEDIKGLSTLLTYNGKSFDIPLLRTRFRINRTPIPFSDYPHIDMVHPCRRLYKLHFESFTLGMMESAIVGFERIDDVPSHLIPYIYFDFLQNRNQELLLPILNHNRDDIVSLYLLAQETGRRIELACNDGCEDDPFLLSLSRISFNNREYDKARTFIDKIKTEYAPDKIADETLFLKSILAKKERNWDEAQSLWREMLDSGKFGYYPHIEMAKHLEHRKKDIKAALELTNNALKLIEFERELSSHTSYKNNSSALKRRHKRLTHKIKKDVGL